MFGAPARNLPAFPVLRRFSKYTPNQFRFALGTPPGSGEVAPRLPDPGGPVFRKPCVIAGIPSRRSLMRSARSDGAASPAAYNPEADALQRPRKLTMAEKPKPEVPPEEHA